MSASGGNDIHPEALKIDPKTEASGLWRLEEKGELRAGVTLASYVCGHMARQGFYLVWFGLFPSRDKRKVNLRRFCLEGFGSECDFTV